VFRGDVCGDTTLYGPLAQDADIAEFLDFQPRAARCRSEGDRFASS
jgi:hypothetical protein